MLLAQEVIRTDAKAEKIALFRFGVIASLVLEPLPRGELTRRAQEIAARHFDIPDSKRTSISVDTLLDWAHQYRSGGFEALAPQPRQDRGQSRTITPQLADLIERLKRENPHRTGATLLRELALSAGQGTAGISASTLYRFLKQRGLSERQLLAPQAHKKFEAEHSNQIWQSDMLYGPYVQRPGGGKMQALLHAILDDASRLIPHAQFNPSQGLDACLDCLRQAVAARGAPIRLYLDNAKIYRSPQLARRSSRRRLANKGRADRPAEFLLHARRTPRSCIMPADRNRRTSRSRCLSPMPRQPRHQNIGLPGRKSY
jgi:putative transposase